MSLLLVPDHSLKRSSSMVLFCCLVKGLLLLMELGVAESSSYQCPATFR